MAPNFGREQQFGGIGVHVPLQAQKFIETFHTADNARLGTRLDAHILQGADKVLHVIGRGMFNAHASITQVADELVHIIAVGLSGVAAHALGQRQVPQETLLHVSDVGNVAHSIFSS